MRVLDLAAEVEGDIARRLVPYQRGLNRRIVEISYRQTPFLAATPEAEIERIARVPERATCRVPRP